MVTFQWWYFILKGSPIHFMESYAIPGYAYLIESWTMAYKIAAMSCYFGCYWNIILVICHLYSSNIPHGIFYMSMPVIVESPICIWWLYSLPELPYNIQYKPHHFQNLNVSRLVLQLSLANPLTPSVKWGMKMQRRQAMVQLHLSDQRELHRKMRIIHFDGPYSSINPAFVFDKSEVDTSQGGENSSINQMIWNHASFFRLSFCKQITRGNRQSIWWDYTL